MSAPALRMDTALPRTRVFTMRDPYDIPDAPTDLDGNHVFSAKLFRGPKGETVQTHYVKSSHDAEAVARKFRHCEVLGFDTEFTSGKCLPWKQQISVIQLASETHIAVFHLALFEEKDPTKVLPPTLKEIFESGTILKTGSCVKLDAGKVEAHLGCKVNGLVDLAKFHSVVRPDVELKPKTLASMTQLYFWRNLDKSANTRCTSWTDELTARKREYAEADAYASVQIHLAIDRIRCSKRLPSVQVLMAGEMTRTPVRKRRQDLTSVSHVGQAFDVLLPESSLRNKKQRTKHSQRTEEVSQSSQGLPIRPARPNLNAPSINAVTSSQSSLLSTKAPSLSQSTNSAVPIRNRSAPHARNEILFGYADDRARNVSFVDSSRMTAADAAREFPRNNWYAARHGVRRLSDVRPDETLDIVIRSGPPHYEASYSDGENDRGEE